MSSQENVSKYERSQHGRFYMTKGSFLSWLLKKDYGNYYCHCCCRLRETPGVYASLSLWIYGCFLIPANGTPMLGDPKPHIALCNAFTTPISPFKGKYLYDPRHACYCSCIASQGALLICNTLSRNPLDLGAHLPKLKAPATGGIFSKGRPLRQRPFAFVISVRGFGLGHVSDRNYFGLSQNY